MKKYRVFLLSCSLSASLYAADGTWTNDTPVDAVFTNTANWVGGIVPSGNSAAIFKGSSVAPGSAIDLIGMSGVKQIRFDVADETWTIGTGAADNQTWLGAASAWNIITMYNNVTADQVVNAAIDWTGANGGTINNTSDNGSSLTVNGRLNAANKNVYFTGDGDASIFMNSTLNGSNTGQRRIDGATVTANSLSTGTYEFMNAGKLTLNNTQNAGAIYFGGIPAGITSGGDDILEIGAGNTLTTTTKMYYRAATNGAANTGTIQGGNLGLSPTWWNVDVQDNAAVAGAELTIASDIVGGKNITKQGAGTLKLTGDNSGSLVLSIQEGRVIANASGVPSSRIHMGKNAQESTFEFIGNTSLNHTAGFRLLANQGVNATVLANQDAGATLQIGTLQGNGTGDQLTLGGSNKGLNQINDNLNDLDTLDNGLTKIGTGTWALHYAQTYLGATDVQAGNLILKDEDTESANTTFTVASGATLSYKFGSSDGGGWVDTAAIGSFTNIGTGFADGSYVGGYVDAADYNLINDSFNFSDQGGNSIGFRKTGAGELSINKTAALSGGLYVDEGTMTFGNGYNGGSMGAGAADALFSADATIASGAELKFSKKRSVQIAGGLAGSGAISISNYNNLATDTPRNNVDTYTVTGDGSQFTGTTTLYDGKLAIGNGGTAGSLGGDIVTTHADQTVTFNRSNVYTNLATISGAGSVVQTGKDALYVTSANTYTGGTQIEDDDLYLYDENGLGTGAITLIDNGIDPRLLLKKKGVTYANAIVFAANGTGNKTLSFWENGSAAVSGDIELNETASHNRVSVGQSSGNSAKLTLSGAISGSGGLKVIGNAQGTLELTGNNTFDGETLVDFGTLIVNGDNSGATGTVTIASDGTLMGSGTIGGAVTVAGSLNPGNSPGALTFNEDLTLASTSILTLEFDTLLSYDQLLNDATGTDTLTIDNAGSIVLDFTGAVFADGDTLNVFQGWESLVDNGANISVVGTDAGNLDTSTLFSGGTIGVTAAIPEPAALSLIVLFGGGLLIAKRRFTK